MKHVAVWRCLAWGLVFWLPGAGPVSSSTMRAQSRDERAVRAAYVYNLIKYVEWPAPGKDLTIALVGDAGTGEVISQLLNGRTREGQTLRVVQPVSVEALQGCSVVYVSAAPESDIRKILERVKGRPILTVGESDGFARAGGMVALVNTGDHIQIEVNLEAVQAGGIRISSRVLGLATIVHSAAKGGDGR
ncbi:MAG TPA: YfiR family protein [Acidobacteriaceae bacterium]|nr:YfiR family protein [Acidobacteriaceae bacterium]